VIFSYWNIFVSGLIIEENPALWEVYSDIAEALEEGATAVLIIIIIIVNFYNTNILEENRA